MKGLAQWLAGVLVGSTITLAALAPSWLIGPPPPHFEWTCDVLTADEDSGVIFCCDGSAQVCASGLMQCDAELAGEVVL